MESITDPKVAVAVSQLQAVAVSVSFVLCSHLRQRLKVTSCNAHQTLLDSTVRPA